MAATLNPVTFLQQVRQELGQVIWPTRAQTIRYTLVVIGVSVAIGIFIGSLDILFVKLTEFFIQR